ncbi:NAD-dependent epimerase/dehydratase family protein [Streptomyces sp. N2-109]|uniref:NAD-dependent epimerase/dehydratase family protein n=1 Tax=Streptomyces gossypii TaxID=2883101 RepID=A0ABT2JMC8_9ACTN|nr:NAD-dependent epimerase/dehydratase family protein [Streptomyces gossypii]MCT2589034.1 NAD-dependent epimerase/dehydratase family protein [Streptomyces gossypii]
MSDQRPHVVLGTGPAGRTLAGELLSRGHQVRSVNRSGRADLPSGATLVTADVTDPHQLRQVTDGAAAVYNCTHVPYEQQVQVLPLIQQSLLTALGPTGTPLVVVDTLSLYGPTGGVPMTEQTPFAATSGKGRIRAELTERYLAAHQRGDVRVALGMAADFFGPWTFVSSLGATTFPNALRGEPVPAFGDPDLPHSYSYLPDVATGLATLGERPEAWGRLWHLPVAPALTTRQVHGLIAELTGRPVHTHVVPEPVPYGPFDAAFMAEYAELFYWHTEPFVMDDSAFTQTFGLHATPMAEALRTTTDWFRRAEAGHTSRAA